MNKPDYVEELRLLAQDHERDTAPQEEGEDEDEFDVEEEDEDDDVEPTEEEEDFADLLKDVAAEVAEEESTAAAPPKPDPGDILAQLVARAKAVAPSTKGKKQQRVWGQRPPSESYTYSPTDYTSTAYVLILVEVQCRNCGALHQSSNGIFLEQRHKTRDESTLKRVEPGSLTSTLPRRREVRSMRVEVCLVCAPTFGF